MNRASAAATVTGNAPAGRCSERVAPLRRRRIAYFINMFPNLIETMIYREVGALRALDTDVFTFSIRRPDLSQVSAEARHFFEGTTYILPVGPLRLIGTHLRALLGHPV